MSIQKLDVLCSEQSANSTGDFCMRMRVNDQVNWAGPLFAFEERSWSASVPFTYTGVVSCQSFHFSSSFPSRWIKKTSWTPFSCYHHHLYWLDRSGARFGFVFLVATEPGETTTRLLSTVFGAVCGSRSSDRRQVDNARCIVWALLCCQLASRPLAPMETTAPCWFGFTWLLSDG